MGKSTISMAIFNSYVSYYQRVTHRGTYLTYQPGRSSGPLGEVEWTFHSCCCPPYWPSQDWWKRESRKKPNSWPGSSCWRYVIFWFFPEHVKVPNKHINIFHHIAVDDDSQKWPIRGQVRSGFCALFSPQISHEDGSEDGDSLALAELPLATHPPVPVGLARSQLGC